MQLNCDMGEGAPDLDALLMPHIEMASIACGGHTGDVISMTRTVQLALKHKVLIGAHPSYPDRENFGRTSIEIEDNALYDSLYQQVSALQTICEQNITHIHYIKPHGALYNDAANDMHLYNLLAKLAQSFSLPLVIPTFNTTHRCLTNSPPAVIYEAFADRAYGDNAQLIPRSQAGAVHEDIAKLGQQAQNIINKKGLYSLSGQWLNIEAETLCIHSDSPSALAGIEAIRTILNAT